MGRGRGKGKRLTNTESHDDPGSGGEEVIPAYSRRRGKPQRPFKDGIDEEVEDAMRTTDVTEEPADDMKPLKDASKNLQAEGKKRRQHPQAKEDSESVQEDSSSLTWPGIKEVASSKSSFRQNGRRRKSTPRRAAEAGVEC